MSAPESFTPFTSCPNCGVEDSVTYNREDETFPYGVAPNTIMLTCVVDKGRCVVCKLEFTDCRAEEARDAAVKKHLRSLVKHPYP